VGVRLLLRGQQLVRATTLPGIGPAVPARIAV